MLLIVVVLLINMFCVDIGTMFTFGQVECHDTQDCISGDVNGGLSSVECWGYRSCLSANAITSVSSIECYGSYSCNKATEIESIGDNDIECAGLMSCAEVDSIIVNSRSLVCSGEQSCSYSNIILLGSDGNLNCYASQSCSNSIITSRNTNTFYGGLAALNSIFYSNDSSVTYWFHGAYSGYNATIYCGIGHTCSIFCAGTGCINLNAICVDDLCASMTIDCQYAEYGAMGCPNGFTREISGININSHIDIGPITDPFPTLINVTMSTSDNSHTACSGSSINYGNYNESFAAVLSTSDDPICCHGYESCTNSINVTAIVVTSSSAYDPVAIRCDGYSSCKQANGWLLSKESGPGNIYITGRDAASPSAMIATTNEYDIFCNGYDSCHNTSILGGNNLYCNGWFSCAEVSLISNFNSVFGYGFKSLERAVLEGIGVVYCAVHDTCHYIRIVNVFDSVYGINQLALYNSTITNVVNNVVGMGHTVLYAATIWNVTNVICIDEFSCLNTTMTSIHGIIYANGDNALSGANIASDTFLNGTLYVYINGTNDDDTFDITCSDNNYCYIECQSSNACTRLSLQNCGSNNCFVSCGSGIDCPYEGIFSEWNTNNPTSIPTLNPTSNQSMIPSKFPTNEPSFNPSFNPTDDSSAMTRYVLFALDPVLFLFLCRVDL